MSFDGRVYDTINSLLFNRGFNKGEIQLDVSDKEYILSTNRTDPTDKIIVLFPTDTAKVGIKTVRAYINVDDCADADEADDSTVVTAPTVAPSEDDILFITQDILRIIIVVRNGVTPIAKSAVTKYNQIRKCCIEFFVENELIIDITKHHLVPPHRLLSEIEKNTIITSLKSKLDQFPKLLRSDAVCKYYNFKKGDLIEITRTSETAGTYIYYRVVI